MTTDRPLDLGHCADDSPYFRSRVSFFENATEDLEKRLRRVGAICRERKELWKRDSALSHELRQLAEGFMGRHVEVSPPPSESSPSVTLTAAAAAQALSVARSQTVDQSVLKECDQCMVDCMEQAMSCLKQIDEHRERFHEQVSMAVVEPLRKFVSSRVQEVRTLGQQYRDANQEAVHAVERLGSCKKHELSAMSEASVALHDARLQQQINACTYVHALNRLHSDKQQQFVQGMMDFVMCEMTTFRLGRSTFDGLDETVSSTYGALQTITEQREAAHAEEKTRISSVLANTIVQRLAVLETFHRVDLHVPANTATANMERMLADAKKKHHPILQVTEQVKMGRKSSRTACQLNIQPEWCKAGYLFHGEQRPVVGVSWRRQFFEIDRGWLRTVSEGDALMKQFSVDALDGKSDRHTVNVDLRLCLVKPALPSDSERNFCFRVIHPSHALLLQAESSSDLNEWMTALQSAAAQALDSSPSVMSQGDGTRSSTMSETTLSLSKTASNGSSDPPAEVLVVEGNGVCADCSSLSPRWASVNLGITLCIECSGVHRSLGTHISQVRSMTLDEMRPEWKESLTTIGNKRSNDAYECFLPPGFNRNFASSSDRRLFIKQKYVDMVFAEDAARSDILAKRQLETSAHAVESERAEEERQQWEVVDQPAADHVATSTPASPQLAFNGGKRTPAPSSPSVFHRMRNSLGKRGS